MLSHRSWIRHVLATLLWLMLVATVGVARAHPFGSSALRAEFSDHGVATILDLDAQTAIDVLELDVSQDGDLEDAEISRANQRIAAYVPQHLSFFNNGKQCTPLEAAQVQLTPLFRFLVELSFVCPGPLGVVRLQCDVFAEDLGGHTVAAHVILAGKRHVLLFTASTSAFEIDSRHPTEVRSIVLAEGTQVGDAALVEASVAQSPWQTFLSFLWQGMLHIWGGIDHLLFVLMLLLGVKRFRELALVVTSFTIAHSITLVLGALELVPAERWFGSSFVESAIAASIVYVAVENLLIDEPPARRWVTFVFGLLHGFGFSSALRALGLPTEGLVPALLAFNLGVELGQLAVVAPLFPGVLWLTGHPRWRKPVVLGGSGVVALIATLWFVERAFGLSFMPM